MFHKNCGAFNARKYILKHIAFLAASGAVQTKTAFLNPEGQKQLENEFNNGENIGKDKNT